MSAYSLSRLRRRNVCHVEQLGLAARDGGLRTLDLLVRCAERNLTGLTASRVCVEDRFCLKVTNAAI
jgi:hypothetical protein